MTGTDLVHAKSGYVTFIGGPRRPLTSDFPRIAYDVPKNTLDPRVETCTDHHVACDCREAILAEDLNEIRSEYRRFQEVVSKVLAGHPTASGATDADSCQCTGCQIARHAYIYPKEVPS